MTTTRDQAVAAAGQALATAITVADSMTVDELVDAAWTPTGPSKEQLRARITRERTERAGRAS